MKCDMCTADDNNVVEKLPAGCHSTKGVGRTEPDPATVKEIDGAKVNLSSTFSCYL
jgi:hypothetical protein